MGLLEFGIGASVIRYVAKYQALNERKNLNSIISTAFIIYSFIGILALILTVFIAFHLETLVNIPHEYLRACKIATLITGINIAIGFPFGVFTAVLYGIQRYDITNAIGILTLLLRAGLVIYFLGNGFGIIALSMILLADSLTLYLLCFYFSRRQVAALRISLNSVNMDSLKVILNYSFFVFLSLIAGRIIFQTYSLVIGYFLSVGMITYFAIAANLTQYLRSGVIAMTNPFTSATSDLEAKKDLLNVQNLLMSWTRYLLILSLPAGIIMATLGKPFISFWMGEKYSHISGTILIILVSSQVLGFPAYLSGAILRGIEKHKFVGYAVILEAISNLILSILLIKGYGLIGVALGSAIPLIIRQLLATPLYICKQLKITLTDYIIKAYLPPLLSSIPCLLICIIFVKLFYPNTIIKLILEIVAATFAHFLLVYFTCLGESEQNKIRRFFQIVIFFFRSGKIFAKSDFKAEH
jgi:O-antigen/teichoic acid export membrane protein